MTIVLYRKIKIRVSNYINFLNIIIILFSPRVNFYNRKKKQAIHAFNNLTVRQQWRGLGKLPTQHFVAQYGSSHSLPIRNERSLFHPIAGYLRHTHSVPSTIIEEILRNIHSVKG